MAHEDESGSQQPEAHWKLLARELGTEYDPSLAEPKVPKTEIPKTSLARAETPTPRPRVHTRFPTLDDLLQEPAPRTVAQEPRESRRLAELSEQRKVAPVGDASTLR